MESKKVAIGVDIGGTKICAGIIDETGNVCSPIRTIATCANAPDNVIIDNLLSLLKETLSNAIEYEVLGIGIGCTGPLDLAKGMILNVENLPTLHNFPLREVVENQFSMTVIMENDANAMIYAEALWGAGKQATSILGFTLGTGIGCAWIHEEKIYQGHSYCSGEIWTSPYKDSILEDYVSGNAITRLYKEYTGKQLPAYRIAELARRGDLNALQAWDVFAQALAYALSWTVNMTDPEKIIIGGSILKSADLYWDKANQLFRRNICTSASGCIPLLPAQLGDSAGFIGAAALILKQ